jgi:predicted nuclease of restriction endonuclease-like (RecB) superfamily
MKSLKNLEQLAFAIQQTNAYFLNKAQQQVNTALTIRNWIIGCHIIEFEQKGKDRAAYGEKLLPSLALRLKTMNLRGMGETNLKLYRQFYLLYPQIGQTASDELQKAGFQLAGIGQLAPDELPLQPAMGSLLNQLSFSHFIELLKTESDEKRQFYEEQTIQNNWPVKGLKRAIESLLYERTGLSKNKAAALQDFDSKVDSLPETVFRNTYLLEFLGLEDKAPFTENDLEERIITNLQHFLLELGRGFCFEHRQRRITFDNKHYRIDLVFYHRILKCHVLLDLKIGEFDHADAGQMNMYLNYYKENESHNGDNPPIGIILCSGKNEALVKYATMGLPQQVFVSKYLVNLPSERELQKIVDGEKLK